MRAVLKRLHSPDAEDLREYKPEDPEDFALLIQAMVGPAEMDGEESFDLEVVTPRRLASRVKNGPMSGLHLLIVSRFDFDMIYNWIRDAVISLEGDDWSSIAERMNRIGRWEFEDYLE